MNNKIRIRSEEELNDRKKCFLEICEILDELIPKNTSYSELITYVKDRLGHDQRYAIDASKIKCELDWAPKYSLKEGLRITISWYVNKFTK